MKKFVIIVAAGSGKRFSNTIPKQFCLLLGKPLLMYPVQAFYDAFSGIRIIIVIANGFSGYWKELCAAYNFLIPHELAPGGTERFHSVKNGLSLIQEEGLVAVHDGARPLVSHDIIHNAFSMAEKYGSAIPVTEVTDSVRKTDGSHHQPIDRKEIRLVQTPQVFKLSILKEAYQQQYNSGFTDDASVVEASGKMVFLTKGEVENIKVTSPLDMIFAEALIKLKTKKP